MLALCHSLDIFKIMKASFYW